MSGEFITAEELGDAYMKCGGSIWYFWAEVLLLRYLPKDNPGGRCYDVPHTDSRSQSADSSF